MDNQLSGTVAELEARDIAIATLQTELDKAKGELEGQVITIGTLENQLSRAVAELERVMGELEGRDIAITNLKSELEARGEVRQLSLFPPEPTKTPEPEPTQTQTPEPETENIESPAVNPEPISLILLDTIEGTVPRKVIMDRILEIDPATEINGQTITDAVLGNNQRLTELETAYRFKFVGYVMKGKNREYRYRLS